MFRLFGIGLKVFPKSNDEVVNGPCFGEGGIAPDNFEDFLPADHMVGTRNEEPEQAHLPLGNAFDLSFPCGDLVAIKVDAASRSKMVHRRYGF